MKYWLLKTEPQDFSIEDLANCPNRTTCWDGVRNYQARNYMRDEMKCGDLVLFYHSSSSPSAIMGTAEVVKEAYPDPTARDKKSPYFDPKSSLEDPRWVMVDIQLKQTFVRPLSLDSLRGTKALAKMELLRKGSRLSVQRVTESEFRSILKLAQGK